MAFEGTRKLDWTQKLHWTQRIALVRHNLHSARRTGDYTFFKTLQAHTLLDGIDHVATLHSVLGDDADTVLSTLDNLNAGIAYVHQDAFKAVYDSAKSTMYKADNSPSSRRSLLRVDIHQQRDMADLAIDKTTNSAINLIETQRIDCQEAIANARITGLTIVADAVCVCLDQMEEVDSYMDDYIRLEYSWTSIQNSVDAAISALRGIFNLMASSCTPNGNPNGSRSLRISSRGAGSDASHMRSRQSSITGSALGLIKRALSVSHFTGPQQAGKSIRTSSFPLPEANPRGFRMSMSTACPTRMSNYADQQHTALTPIPHTPGANDITLSPFKERNDYFTTFDLGTAVDPKGKEGSASEDLMQL
jgi:hypothetical protein